MKQLALLCLSGMPFVIQAHDFSGNLGESVAATDYLLVSCQADGSITADKLYFQLTSESVGASQPLISAQIAKGNLVTNVTDLSSGDFIPSRNAEIAGGQGIYRVTLNKNKAGKAAYSFVYHCQSNSGEHAETNTIILQDQ